MSDLDQLRALGDQLLPPPLDSLREVALRRTRRMATIALVAVVVVTVGLTVALRGIRGGDDVQQPTGPVLDGTRHLAYAEGATIHLGDSVVQLPAPVAEIDMTDAGAVVRTDDDRIWFTDGDRLSQVGEIGAPGAAYENGERPTYSPNGWVVSGNTGSLAAWFEFPTPGAPVLVVYDTASQETVVDRQALTVRGETWELLQSVTDAAAYWFVDPGVDDVVPAGRLDLSTGRQTLIGRARYVAELPAEGSARTLVNNDDGTWPFAVMDGVGQQFGVEDGRFTPVGGGDFRVWDGLTGEPVQYEAPPGYRSPMAFLAQWIDDDTVVLRATVKNGRDLLVCRNSTHACTVAVSGSSSLTVPGLS